jgi:tetratricopeptide (TPR) repeat protein
MSVGLTPLAFLALGAAGPAISTKPRDVVARAATAALLPVALIAGLLLLAGDYHLEQALLDFSLSHARTANLLLPRWPQPASRLALVYTFEAKTERSAAKRAEAIAWRREAIRRDPTDPRLWSDLADLEANLGRFGDATRDFRHALRRDPLSVRALDGLGEVALATGDRGAAARWFRRSLAVDPNQPSVRRQVSRLR